MAQMEPLMCGWTIDKVIESPVEDEVDESKGEQPPPGAGGQDAVEEKEERKEFFPRFIHDPTVISCHLLINLINDAITMLRYLGMVTQEFLRWEWVPIEEDEEDGEDKKKPDKSEAAGDKDSKTEGDGEEEEDSHAGEELIYPAIEELSNKLEPKDEEGNKLHEDPEAQELVARLTSHAEATMLWKEEYDKLKGILKFSHVVTIPNNGMDVETEGIEIIPQTEKALISSAWLLACYLLNREYARDQLEELGHEAHPVFAYLIECLEKLQKVARRRYSTTLVEDEAIEGYRRDIFERELQFIKENYRKADLLEEARQSRADDYARYLNDEKNIQLDKDNSVVLAKQMEDNLKADCAALAAQEIAAFDAENNALSADNNAMFAQLFELQNKDRDKELQQRGKKGQSIEEVVDLMWVYEDDIKQKTTELRELIVQEKELSAKFYKMYHFFFEKARLAALKAEEEILAREANVAKRRKRWLPHYAAKRIQRYWGRYLERKNGGPPPGKGKGNGKGKGKGKGKKGKKN